MKKLTVEKKLDKKAAEAIVKDDKLSKSAKIRQLFEGGLETKEIADMIGVRYNFVYNVLQNYTIMNDIEVTTTQRDSKRDDIVKLLNEGKSLADVSRATKTNYNYIWKISKELKTEQAAQTTNTEEKEKVAK